jgi:hypothetical protein
MQGKAARDRMRAWIKEALPSHKHAAKRPKTEQFEKYLPKFQKILERGYVVPSKHIKSLTDYFDVPKDNDIRLVYNGTSCGLNWSLWAPNFWLPTAKRAIRFLGFGYFSVDIDLGEMFLNFPLPAILWEYSGVDLSSFRKALEELMKATFLARFWVCWEKCWIGLRPSPYMAIRFYYWAEEFARGNPRDKESHLRWDEVVLNLPGDPSFDPAMPRVYKLGYSREHDWAIARQVSSRMQYLGIQDAPRKRRPPDTHPGLGLEPYWSPNPAVSPSRYLKRNGTKPKSRCRISSRKQIEILTTSIRTTGWKRSRASSATFPRLSEGWCRSRRVSTSRWPSTTRAGLMTVGSLLIENGKLGWDTQLKRAE